MEFVKSFKQTKLIKYIFIALIGSVLLAISSKVKIPFYPVPMTMQTFVVLLIGLCFGWKLGVATISLYLFEGLIGFWCFQELRKRYRNNILHRTNDGLLDGFVVAGFLAGRFIYDNNYLKNF